MKKHFYNNLKTNLVRSGVILCIEFLELRQRK